MRLLHASAVALFIVATPAAAQQQVYVYGSGGAGYPMNDGGAVHDVGPGLSLALGGSVTRHVELQLHATYDRLKVSGEIANLTTAGWLLKVRLFDPEESATRPYVRVGIVARRYRNALAKAVGVQPQDQFAPTAAFGLEHARPGGTLLFIDLQYVRLLENRQVFRGNRHGDLVPVRVGVAFRIFER